MQDFKKFNISPLKDRIMLIFVILVLMQHLYLYFIFLGFQGIFIFKNTYFQVLANIKNK